MPLVVYNLDDAINSFFSDAGASSSRAECDEIARQRCGGRIRPVDVQGVDSYTVIAGPNDNKIIQFREQAAPLDIKILALAKDVHGDIVPSCSEISRIGDPTGSQLVMYEMERLLGENCVIARLSLARERRLNIVCGLVNFFVQAWQKSLPADSDLVNAIGSECYTRFEYLANTLPRRFLPAVTQVRTALPSLLDGHYPMVLTHADLNEMNILVDPDSGDITGIVDWSSASIQPFGFALYALENALGTMGDEGWKWYDNADDLRATFWGAFREQTGIREPEIKLLRLAGKACILIRYGTAYDAGYSGPIGVRDPDGEDFGFLDAHLL